MVGPRRIAEKKVAYSSSVHTEGSLPNDTEYDVGKPVTLAKNTGNLVKPGYRLIGWSDGINLYSLGATVTFYMNTDTLHAVWKAGYTITYHGNGNTGGTVAVEPNAYDPEQTVTVLDNTGNLVRAKHTFAGWFINGISDRTKAPDHFAEDKPRSVFFESSEAQLTQM